MKTSEAKYIKIIENPKDKNNYLEITFYYDLGGYNFGTGKPKPRGYYLRVTPVEKSITASGLACVSFTAFTGYYDLLLPVNRQSKKSENAAREKLPAVEKMLVNYIARENGYIIQEAATV